MPYLTGPACIIGSGCEAPAFPQSEAECYCTPAAGGINELYFIPCTETFSLDNLTDLDFWTRLVGGGEVVPTLGRSGLGLGSISKKSDKKDRVASCRTEQITQIIWALKYGIKCFDKTAARVTCAKINELILKGQLYLVVARMCDGDDVILPIGKFDVSDLNWTVPDNAEDNQLVEIELSWRELGLPCTIDVAGLSTVLPKLG